MMQLSAEVLKDFYDKYRQIFVEFEAIGISVNESKRLIAELIGKYGEIDSLKALEGKFDLVVKSQKASCETLRIENESLKREVENCRQDISKMNKSIVDIRERLDQNDSIAREYCEKQKAQNKSDQDSFRSWVDVLKKEFSEEISSLRKDLVVSPALILENNEQLMLRIQSAELDGTNAMLKVNNMDTNYRIIEKKIESLLILLKKIELSQAK